MCVSLEGGHIQPDICSKFGSCTRRCSRRITDQKKL